MSEGNSLVQYGHHVAQKYRSAGRPARSASVTRLPSRPSRANAFGACGNTMKAFNITLEQLPAGTRALPQGGVVRVMELVEQGYVYIRP